jgi:outer membrane immunogenic protein
VTLDSASATNKLNGVIGGLQAGYNWQSANWVYGLEADIQWTGQKGSIAFSCVTAVPCGFPPAINTTIDQKLKWFGTLRGRVGTTTFSPTVIAYVTGGLAYGEITTDVTLSGANANAVATSAAGSFSTTKAGWVVGAGVEGRIIGNWTGKIEYLYMDLGTVSGGPLASLVAPAVRTNFANASFSSRITDNILRVGLNYKFTP